MPGYAFPDPISKKILPLDNQKLLLVVTDYGTVIGNKNIKEQTIDAFISNIEKNMKTWYLHLDDNTYKHSVRYHTRVENNGNDSYLIVIENEEYNLKLDVKSKYYPMMKNKLDELSKETKKNLNKEKTINDLEKNINLEEHENQEDLQTYLKFLTSNSKKYFKKFIVNTLIATITNAGLFAFLFAGFLLAQTPESISAIVTGFLIAGCILNGVILSPIGTYKKISSMFKIHKLINIRIKGFTNKLNKIRNINFKINSQQKENEPKKDIYKENIINYMNSIMLGANKLNKKERYRILIELRDVLDEYTLRMQKYNENHNKGLTLEDDKQVIMHYTIEKLVTLEMEISEIRKKDTENKLITDDSFILREKLNEYIDTTSDEQKEQSSKALVRTMQ